MACVVLEVYVVVMDVMLTQIPRGRPRDECVGGNGGPALRP